MPRIRDPRESGVYTSEMGQPPDEPDMGSVKPRPRMRGSSDVQTLPGHLPPGTTLEDLIEQKTNKRRSSSDMQTLPGRVLSSSSLEELVSPKNKNRTDITPLKNGGKVSASSRADGIATKGKTKGRFV